MWKMRVNSNKKFCKRLKEVWIGQFISKLKRINLKMLNKMHKSHCLGVMILPVKSDCRFLRRQDAEGLISLPNNIICALILHLCMPRGQEARICGANF